MSKARTRKTSTRKTSQRYANERYTHQVYAHQGKVTALMARATALGWSESALKRMLKHRHRITTRKRIPDDRSRRDADGKPLKSVYQRIMGDANAPGDLENANLRAYYSDQGPDLFYTAVESALRKKYPGLSDATYDWLAKANEHMQDAHPRDWLRMSKEINAVVKRWPHQSRAAALDLSNEYFLAYLAYRAGEMSEMQAATAADPATAVDPAAAADPAAADPSTNTD